MQSQGDGDWLPAEKVVLYLDAGCGRGLGLHKETEISFKSAFRPVSTVAVGGDKQANETYLSTKVFFLFQGILLQIS